MNDNAIMGDDRAQAVESSRKRSKVEVLGRLDLCPAGCGDHRKLQGFRGHSAATFKDGCALKMDAPTNRQREYSCFVRFRLFVQIVE